MIEDAGRGFEFDDDAALESGLDAELDTPASMAGPADLTDDRGGVLARAAERGREEFYGVADRGKDRLADAIEMGIDELDDRLSHTAHYLRTHDVEVIRDDFIQQVRRHPLLSVGIAVGTGYLVGKALGGKASRGRRGRLRAKAGQQLRRALVAGLAAVVAARSRPEPELMR